VLTVLMDVILEDKKWTSRYNLAQGKVGTYI